MRRFLDEEKARSAYAEMNLLPGETKVLIHRQPNGNKIVLDAMGPHSGESTVFSENSQWQTLMTSQSSQDD